jgi:hypothetical protein
VATWDDVRRIALSLPEATEGTGAGGIPSWAVRKKGFAWERPLRKYEIAALGAAAPQGAILAAHVPDIGPRTLHHATLLVEAWLAKAPKRLVQGWLDARR